MSCPASVMAPAVGVSKPASMRNNVDLPQPELPSSAKISPLLIATDTSFTARRPSNSLTRLRIDRKGWPAAGEAIVIESVIELVKNQKDRRNRGTFKEPRL